MNLIINNFNSTGITKIGDLEILRKIVFVLPQNSYASIITILHNIEDLSTMTLGFVISKLVVVYEIS